MGPKRTRDSAREVTQVTFVWLFSTVCLQTFPQTVCSRGCIMTQVAFVCLFSTVSLQMCPQITRLRGYIITQAAFVWLFSTVGFQMSAQIACVRGCIITQAAFVCPFIAVCFHMSPQMACMSRCIITLIAFFPLTSFCHAHPTRSFFNTFAQIIRLQILIHFEQASEGEMVIHNVCSSVSFELIFSVQWYCFVKKKWKCKLHLCEENILWESKSAIREWPCLL